MPIDEWLLSLRGHCSPPGLLCRFHQLANQWGGWNDGCVQMARFGVLIPPLPGGIYITCIVLSSSIGERASPHKWYGIVQRQWFRENKAMVEFGNPFGFTALFIRCHRCLLSPLIVLRKLLVRTRWRLMCAQCLFVDVMFLSLMPNSTAASSDASHNQFASGVPHELGADVDSVLAFWMTLGFKRELSLSFLAVGKGGLPPAGSLGIMGYKSRRRVLDLSPCWVLHVITGSLIFTFTPFQGFNPFTGWRGWSYIWRNKYIYVYIHTHSVSIIWKRKSLTYIG